MIFIPLFILPFLIRAQEVKNDVCFDTITIKFTELLDVDYRLKMTLDDFIKNMPLSFHKLQRTNFILIEINAYLTYKAQESLIDSLYKDNEFQEGVYLFPYAVYIESIRKKSKNLLTIAESQQCYQYKYRGFDVIIVTPLQLKFPWIGSYVNKKYVFSTKNDYTTTYYSVYTIGDFEVIKRKYIKLYSSPSGVPLQKKYYKDKEKTDLLKNKKSN